MVKLQDGSSGVEPGSSEGTSDTPESEARRVPERLTRPSVPALDAILGQPFPASLTTASFACSTIYDYQT